MGEILRKFIYTFFRELTYRSDPSTDFHAYGSNDADSRNGMPFGGFVDITPHFGGEIQWRRWLERSTALSIALLQ